jgi:hypothetical protein
VLKYPLFVLVFSRIRLKSTSNIGSKYFYVGSTYFCMVNLASSTKVLSWNSGNFSEKRVQAGGSSPAGCTIVRISRKS